jgi:XTP/dITP diphosphohydrolase
MLRLVIATNNRYKIEEISNLIFDHLMAKGLNQKLEIIGLEEIGCHEAIPETSNTIEGNASQKASYVSLHYGCNCFADDTGLEVNVLNGRPGLHSARYAGDDQNSDRNITKLLDELKHESDRKARFRTIISLIINGREILFEGMVKGEILRERRGTTGFGYDPVFLPDGYNRTFAEMSLDEKNRISHRALAVMKMIDYLEELLTSGRH